ncbi:hypothetical protein WMY93_007089 [Mugilogobius chulae]|uniref:Uncharacterized protein n=1 Tax=Mugilogobius chulae TaxID=88201 RepID=A0AAW0PW96_9GOBI
MAETIFGFKAYPTERDLAKAAEALVTTHPCLSERGSETVWYGWKIRLAHKMGNYRTIMSKSGCAEVAVNTGKRSKHNPESEHPHSNIKKPRRSEVNFLPNFPKGENQLSLEEIRLQMKEEMEKTEKDELFIGRSMQTTFALRRQEIVTGDKPVKDLLTRWPALHMESQTLIGLYRQKASRTGKISEALQKILREYDLQQEQDVILKRTLSLRALSVYLKEEDSDFYLTCNEDGEQDASNCPLALQSSAQTCLDQETSHILRQVIKIFLTVCSGAPDAELEKLRSPDSSC